jgi:hypothetical protein
MARGRFVVAQARVRVPRKDLTFGRTEFVGSWRAGVIPEMSVAFWRDLLTGPEPYSPNLDLTHLWFSDKCVPYQSPIDLNWPANLHLQFSSLLNQ